MRLIVRHFTIFFNSKHVGARTLTGITSWPSTTKETSWTITQELTLWHSTIEDTLGSSTTEETSLPSTNYETPSINHNNYETTTEMLPTSGDNSTLTIVGSVIAILFAFVIVISFVMIKLKRKSSRKISKKSTTGKNRNYKRDLLLKPLFLH